MESGKGGNLLLFHFQGDDHGYHRLQVKRYDAVVSGIAEKIDRRELTATVMWQMMVVVAFRAVAVVLFMAACRERIMHMVLVRYDTVGERHEICQRTKQRYEPP